jgi:hypothetical protein
MVTFLALMGLMLLGFAVAGFLAEADRFYVKALRWIAHRTERAYDKRIWPHMEGYLEDFQQGYWTRRDFAREWGAGNWMTSGGTFVTPQIPTLDSDLRWLRHFLGRRYWLMRERLNTRLYRMAAVPLERMGYNPHMTPEDYFSYVSEAYTVEGYDEWETSYAEDSRA